jgi:trimeric autotransporter adhesin
VKKSIIFIILLQLLWIVASAQTHYGTSAGTLGQYHSYFGYFAGNAAISTSTENSFFGNSSGRNTTSGYSNTGVGYTSLRLNTTGYQNTAVGASALFNNTNGDKNTAVGFEALTTNDFTQQNTAVGAWALRNSQGENNTAVGYAALINITAGSNNSAFGTHALGGNSPGSYNSVFGSYALSQGQPYLCSGSYNSAFGANITTTNCSYTNFTVLGYAAQATASNQVRIGNLDVTSIGGQVSWSTLSDGRFKKDIRKDVAGLDFINQLNPVSYSVDKDSLRHFLGLPDSLRVPTTEAERNARQVGFIAQEVDDLVKKTGYVFTGIEAPKNENDTYTIRYAEFVVPLVKAVQELTAQVEELKAQLEQQANESVEEHPFYLKTISIPFPSALKSKSLYLKQHPKPASSFITLKENNSKISASKTVARQH